MITVTKTQLLNVTIKVITIFILLAFDKSFQSFLQWLTVLPKPSLQVNCTFLWTQRRMHELGIRPAERHPFSMVVHGHCILVYPQYGT